MQKLKEVISKNDGSTLVAVVVFAIVIAIGALGYLHVMSNTVGHEVDALNDELAYQTAESGLLIGLGWIQNGDNWENRSTNPNLYNLEDLNNMTCVVSLEVIDDETILKSTVTSPALTYEKVLSFTKGVQTHEKYLWVNRIYPLDESHSWGGGGLQVARFFGSVHSNCPLYISSTVKGAVQINGLFSVTNNTEEEHFEHFPYYNGEALEESEDHMGDFGGGEDGTKYKFGILKHDIVNSQGTDQSKKLNEYFSATGDFLHSQPELSVGDLTGDKYFLPQSEGTDSIARLVFLPNGKARYTSFDIDDKPTDPALPLLEMNIIDKKILIAQNTIEVLGTVSTNTTVTNIPNKGDSIIIIGDITYGDKFDESKARDGIEAENYGVDPTVNENSPILTLFSEGDIYISPNIRELDAGNNVVTSTQNELFVTALLFAAREGHGIKLPTSKTGSFDKTQFPNKFKFYNVGSRAIDTWFNVGPQAAGMFTYYFDYRLQNDLQGYGVPDLRTTTGNDILLGGIWKEENFPLNP